MSSRHPDEVLQAFLAKSPRPQKVKNLHAIHDLCSAEYQAGSKDFSLAVIGKLCEQRGVLKARGLYNAPLADYRTLIDAWASYAGPRTPKSAKQTSTDDYVGRIEDPAIRMLVQSAIAERNKLRAQLNTLKAATTVVVDRRPKLESPQFPQGRPGKTVLTDSEQRALQAVLKQDFLASQGWSEVAHGEVVNSRGRTIFDPGFLTGLRKLIGNDEQQS